MDIREIVDDQRIYFQSGATLPVEFRVEMLKKLREAVQKHESEISEALKTDLGKGDFESYCAKLAWYSASSAI